MKDCFAKLLGLNEEEESPHNYQESERHPSNDRPMWSTGNLPGNHNLISDRNKAQERLLVASPKQEIGKSDNKTINSRIHAHVSKQMLSWPA